MAKKIIVSLLVALILFLILMGVIYLVFKFKPKEEPSPIIPVEMTLEEKIKSATAPERTEPLSPEEQQRIEKLIESATAPERTKPLSETEQQRIEKLLESATAPVK